MSFGSNIRNAEKLIPDPGSRGQKSTGSGSATQVLPSTREHLCVSLSPTWFTFHWNSSGTSSPRARYCTFTHHVPVLRIRIGEDPHHLDNLDPHPDPHPIKIRIRIKISSAGSGTGSGSASKTYGIYKPILAHFQWVWVFFLKLGSGSGSASASGWQVGFFGSRSAFIRLSWILVRIYSAFLDPYQH